MAALFMSSSSLSLPKPLSFSSLTSNPLLPLVLSFPPRPSPSLTIRNGGGPRTFPGGVSKWQWKRMQAKKAKQLLKARLLRERQIYDMRKRAELKAAAADLERPWDPVAAAPALFSVAADDQVKALADRFQRPGGFDMWSPRDGPRVLPAGGPHPLLPSSRFFPKGVVHSVKPYGRSGGDTDAPPYDDWVARGAGGVRRRRSRRTTPDHRECVRANSPVEFNGTVDVRLNSSEKENHLDVDVRRYGLISPLNGTERKDRTTVRTGYRSRNERGRDHDRVPNADSVWNSGEGRAPRNVDNERGGNRVQNRDSKWGLGSGGALRSVDDKRGGNRAQMSDSKRIYRGSGTPKNDRRNK